MKDRGRQTNNGERFDTRESQTNAGGVLGVTTGPTSKLSAKQKGGVKSIESR